MKTDKHVLDRVAGLAALAAGDPEREAALAHCQQCSLCKAAFEDASKVIDLLDALPSPPLPSAEVLQRVRASIVSDLKPRNSELARPAGAHTSAQNLALRSLIPLLTLASAFIVVGISAHSRESARAQAAFALVVALAAFFAFVGQTRYRVHALGLALLASAVFAASAGSAPGISLVLGLKCLAIEVASASLPVAGLLWVVTRDSQAICPWRCAAVAAAGALAGQGALHLSCPEHAATGHLALFHFGGVLAAALAAKVAGHALIAQRA